MPRGEPRGSRTHPTRTLRAVPRPSTEPADAPDSRAVGPPVAINILVSFAWWLIACTLPSMPAWTLAYLFMQPAGATRSDHSAQKSAETE